ncbi:MAG TPA: 6-pyruvoyl tetrahydropterin synthase family protein [Candidatus Kapabacteria bacterium]|nr:6-pyruvoyl tetrahydropterin synthase family protein [Candidatus Kapabacteria bacterium]
MRIACDFHWEMGHRLPEHFGACKNVHGHSYRMNVEVEGEVRPSGMVMDFFDLKKSVQPLVDKLDHSFLCDESDMLMKKFLQEAKLNIVLVPFPTTAENITKYFIEAIGEQLKAYRYISRITVRVSETASSYAEESAIINAKT